MSPKSAAPLCVVGEAGRGQTLCGLSVERNCQQLRRDLLFGKMNMGWTFLGDCAFLAKHGGVSGNGEKQRGQEAVLVDIVEAACAESRIQRVYHRHEHSHLSRELVMSCEQIYGNYTACKHYRLPYLKRQGRRENVIEGQQKIIYRRYVYRKV